MMTGILPLTSERADTRRCSAHDLKSKHGEYLLSKLSLGGDQSTDCSVVGSANLTLRNTWTPL